MRAVGSGASAVLASLARLKVGEDLSGKEVDDVVEADRLLQAAQLDVELLRFGERPPPEEGVGGKVLHGPYCSESGGLKRVKFGIFRPFRKCEIGYLSSPRVALSSARARLSVESVP